MSMWHISRRVMVVSLCCLTGALGSATAAQATAPTVTSISPNNGPAAGGASVGIAGSGFIAGSTVKFGSTAAASVTINSSVSITATSPAGSGSEPVNVTVTNSNGTSASVPKDQFAYDPAPASSWLGLDGNSGGLKGEHLGEFVANNIVYDRGGAPGLDMPAGELLEEGGKQTEVGLALATSTGAGMIPDVTIEYKAYQGNYQSDPDFPQERTKKEEEEGKETIKGYVEAFIESAKVIHEKYPSAIFEPMNEPWGYTTPHFNAVEYANVIAKLLPEAKTAGIPLSSIYVGATGKNCANPAKPTECTTDGWVPTVTTQVAKRETEEKLATEVQVQGWYFHPYGPANGSGTEEGDSKGIKSVPLVQEAMTSGQNNIIVSEVGFCSHEVGAECNPEEPESATEAGQHLGEMLDNALPYHEAGWLRALIVYARNAGGWAMQLSNSLLTAQGQSLDNFEFSLQPPTYSSVFGSSGSGKLSAPLLDAVDASGDVWVVDTGNDRIVEFSSSGSFVRSVGEKGEGNGQFRVPAGIAINHQTGDIYVTDEFNKRIQEFSSTGGFITTFGNTGEGALEYPFGITVDSSGDVWVIRGISGGAVEEFSSTGSYLRTIHVEPGQPTGVTFSGGELYVLSSSTVLEYSPTGTYIGQFGTKGSGPGRLASPLGGITTDPANGDLYIADTGNRRVEAFTPAGTYLNTFGSEGTGPGQFEEPAGITINNSGEIYVTDYTNNRVEQWVP
jgi:sugar lactone lactonase YvrE